MLDQTQTALNSYEVDDGERAGYERKYKELADLFESLNYQVTQTENSYDTIDWCVGHAIATPKQN